MQDFGEFCRKVLSTPFWFLTQHRSANETEAYIDLYTLIFKNETEISLNFLGRRWGWTRNSVDHFLSEVPNLRINLPNDPSAFVRLSFTKEVK